MALFNLRKAVTSNSMILETAVKLGSRLLSMSTYFGVNREFLLDLFLAAQGKGGFWLHITNRDCLLLYHKAKETAVHSFGKMEFFVYNDP